jgi:hypothetical protein
MERMWQERADYGHFFYRIPDGESAADAYDRVSGFNESMWRQFGEADFPSVCVLVTHGLMTRVFLMKWYVGPSCKYEEGLMLSRYHWSVEYFEDLRNINHCEFIVMKQNQTNGRYILQNELRTWSDLKKRAAATTGTSSSTAVTSTRGAPAPGPGNLISSPTIPIRRWGGCANGCDHDKMNWPRRAMRKNTAEYLGGALPPPSLPTRGSTHEEEEEDHPIVSQEADHTSTINEPNPGKLTHKPSQKGHPTPATSLTPASPNDASNDGASISSSDEGIRSSEEEAPAVSVPRQSSTPRTAAILRHLNPPRKTVGPGTPGDVFSDDSDYFPGMHHVQHHRHADMHTHTSPGKNLPAKRENGTHGKSRLRASSKQRQQSKERKAARKMSEQSWMQESGMGSGARADTLGDGEGDATSDEARKTSSPTSMQPSDDKYILREALKGDMLVEKSEDEGGDSEVERVEKVLNKQIDAGELKKKDIEKMEDEEKKGFGEVY